MVFFIISIDNYVMPWKETALSEIIIEMFNIQL